MTERSFYTGTGKLADKTGRDPLRCQGHKGHARARLHEEFDIFPVRHADHRRIMHARLLGRKERPCEVNAKNAWIGGRSLVRRM